MPDEQIVELATASGRLINYREVERIHHWLEYECCFSPLHVILSPEFPRMFCEG